MPFVIYNEDLFCNKKNKFMVDQYKDKQNLTTFSFTWFSALVDAYCSFLC